MVVKFYGIAYKFVRDHQFSSAAAQESILRRQPPHKLMVVVVVKVIKNYTRVLLSIATRTAALFFGRNVAADAELKANSAK